MRGGEKVLEALCELFPQADIFTHVLDRSKISPTILRHRITQTSVGQLPFAKKWYKKYLTFMPKALEDLDLRGYDLILSSESGPAKGIISHSHTPHICYCHTPMRYLWDYYHEYLAESGLLTRWVFRQNALKLRLWDLATAQRVDHFIANSHNVAQRIQHIYHRSSDVVHPPIQLSDFYTVKQKKDYYLFLGQLVGYKRADLVIEAFKQHHQPVYIVGSGKVPRNLPPNIKVLGHVSHEQKADLLAHARALIFPGEEDFGIVPLEALASGTPVIAFGKGGVLETVINKKTGIFFYEQTVNSLLTAIKIFEEMPAFSAPVLRQYVEIFDKPMFLAKINTIIDQYTQNRSQNQPKT